MIGLKGALKKEVRARRRTQKGVGLGNALPWMIEGSKAHSKGGKVRKRTTLNTRGLKGALEKR
jgi:hypothetical protein